MDGYGEVLAAWQDARVEVALWECDTNVSGSFDVCMVHAASPYSCGRPCLADTGASSVAAVALATVRAPPLESECDGLCFPTVAQEPTTNIDLSHRHRRRCKG
jgi:hypothetical protein